MRLIRWILSKFLVPHEALMAQAEAELEREELIRRLRQPARSTNAPELSPESRLVQVPSSVVEYAEVALGASSDHGDQYVAMQLRNALTYGGYAPEDPPDTSWLELESVRTAHPWARKRKPPDRSWVFANKNGEYPS